MSLSKPNAAFETQDTTDEAVQTAVENVADTAAAEVQQPAEAAQTTAVQTAEAAATPSTTTAVATAARTTALAAPREGSRAELLARSNVMVELKDAMPVTWEDFNSINANQGQFLVKSDNNKQLGNKISLRLVSFQDQYVSAPEDTEADGEDLVRYSNDGVVSNNDDGMTLADHQAYLKGLNLDCKISHRLVLVGELLEANEAGMDQIGNLVQVVLADSGRRNFESHTKQSAFHICEGRLSKSDAEYVTLTATLAGTGKKQYTLVKTSYMDGHGAKPKGATA